MIKKVFRPFWSFDVKKTEQWLSSMAGKGFILVKINRATRTFFFQQGEPRQLTYRLGFDKNQGDSLSNRLVVEGWRMVWQGGKWYVLVIGKHAEQIETSPVREGIIKHNRTVMYIFAGLFIYLSLGVLMNLLISLFVFFDDATMEVVDSPYWIITYLSICLGILLYVLSIYSIIKIMKTNKILANETIRRNILSRVNNVDERLPKAEEKQLKRSGQLVVKRKLAWMYAPDKLEGWLENMESQGFNLYRVSKTGTVFYFFVGKPRKMSYCADYQNLSNESYFDIHRDAGWKSVFISIGSIQKWTIWSQEYSAGEERPEIYSDKTHQLKHAKRIATAYSCLFLPLIILYSFNIGIGIDLIDKTGMGKMQIINMIIIVLAILSFGSYSIRTWLYYGRLKKRNDQNL